MGNILEGLVDNKIRSILNVFIRNKDELFHLKKVSQLSKVPLATSFRLMRRLVQLRLIEVIRIDKFKVYRFAKNEKTKLLMGILKNE